eukprot:jgi/Hompol1/577/HPOL_004169-RA
MADRKSKPTPRIKDLKFLLASKIASIRNTSSDLAAHASRMAELVDKESKFYGSDAMELRRHNWPLKPRLGSMNGAVLYVDYGFRNAGSRFEEISEAEVIRDSHQTKVDAINSLTVVPVHRSPFMLEFSFLSSNLPSASQPPSSNIASYIPVSLQGAEKTGKRFSADLAIGRLAVFESELFSKISIALLSDNRYDVISAPIAQIILERLTAQLESAIQTQVQNVQMFLNVVVTEAALRAVATEAMGLFGCQLATYPENCANSIMFTYSRFSLKFSFSSITLTSSVVDLVIEELEWKRSLVVISQEPESAESLPFIEKAQLLLLEMYEATH